MLINPIPDAPTWTEIGDGLEAAAAASQNASKAARESEAEAKRARAAADKHRADQLEADRNLEQWLAKAKRKAYKP